LAAADAAARTAGAGGAGEADVTGPGELTVATYNIHRCVGLDRRRDPERIARVIAELAVDLVGLQEVDARHGLRRAPDQFDFFAKAIGGNAIRGPNIRGPRGEMGNALITRHPVREARLLDLSLPGREPRGAIDADIEVNGLVVRVVVAHLGLRVAERRIQVARLVEAIEGGGATVIVMGDFNEWHLHRSTLTPLDTKLGHSTPVPSFPARFPFLSLDRIWAGPDGAVSGIRVHRTPLARRASDHLPVRAQIRWHGPLA
jgi:endonuclease/exonuclease/phosphatase family metal-dependent hydrolase